MAPTEPNQKTLAQTRRPAEVGQRTCGGVPGGGRSLGTHHAVHATRHCQRPSCRRTQSAASNEMRSTSVRTSRTQASWASRSAPARAARVASCALSYDVPTASPCVSAAPPAVPAHASAAPQHRSTAPSRRRAGDAVRDVRQDFGRNWAGQGESARVERRHWQGGQRDADSAWQESGSTASVARLHFGRLPP